MEYIIKKINGSTVQMSGSVLRHQVEAGVVGREWPAKAEGSDDWSTVDAILNPNSIKPSSSSESRLEVTNNRNLSRYTDSYLVARTVVGFGFTVKILAFLIGICVAAISIFTAAKSHSSITFFGGLVIAFVVAVPIYILGVLVSAQGQILKATLDTAVNSSQFLTKEEMRQIMSLD